MLMSKSRLEKFLYALYSLDSSDLPAPLSRIEELYKCLVTGEEAPTFEPLSRVEKYLMAILGVYDVELLPNPLSRVEVLLYKLATGDDNLDDVKSFLSEHEELLAEIIRNGGTGGNIDIEYVLYALSTEFSTLYNTAEKPIKSAILKGKTLVNLHKLENYSVYGVVLDGGINQHFGNDTSYSTWRMFDISMLKPNTEYGVFCWVLENTISGEYWDGHYHHSADTVFNPSTELRFSAGEIGLKFAKLTTISDFTGKTCGIRHLININTPSSEYVKFRCVIVEYQEGMENWDIPYFEGMQSVKMPVLKTTGKNLFDGELISGYYEDGSLSKIIENTSELYKTIRLNLKKGTYTFSFEESVKFVRQLKDGVYDTFAGDFTKFTTTLQTDGTYILSFRKTDNSDFDLTKIQIEQGSTATSYEPYKSNILTVNEDIELRGIGEVKDELNLLTGELAQRVNEIVLNGSEEWTLYEHNMPSVIGFYTSVALPNVLPALSYDERGMVLSDTFIFKNQFLTNDEEFFFISNTGKLNLNIKRSKLSAINVTSFKSYLTSNPLTIQYQLATESVKTVDLSVVNQDGNNTKLSTFNDITHVTLYSEGLIPKAELEVATKNEEVLNTMSLEMDDISKTQNDLQETLDTQSENVDSTMIATTEIYEGLL